MKEVASRGPSTARGVVKVSPDAEGLEEEENWGAIPDDNAGADGRLWSPSDDAGAGAGVAVKSAEMRPKTE